MARERHQVILSESAAGWVRTFSKEKRHSISKAISILVEEAIRQRSIPAMDAAAEGMSQADFSLFLREKFSMDFEIWLRSKRG